MKQFLHKYKHAWTFLYLPIYLLWFTWLERTVTDEYHEVRMDLDSYIPFQELFIIPYLLWFVFISAVVLYFFFTNKRDFYRICIFLFIGMSVSLFICTIWPNGQNLRPNLETLGRDNIFIKLVGFIYATDTPTNVCPSIHVLNSVGCCIAIFHSNALKGRHVIRIATLILTISICASTIFLKQHSCFDLLCGLLLSLVMYWLAYLPKFERIPEEICETSTT
ncbi:MAG: phosphatase PAP2 family protein [Lachnospiraceae bacterium]